MGLVEDQRGTDLEDVGVGPIEPDEHSGVSHPVGDGIGLGGGGLARRAVAHEIHPDEQTGAPDLRQGGREVAGWRHENAAAREDQVEVEGGGGDAPEPLTRLDYRAYPRAKAASFEFAGWFLRTDSLFGGLE